MADLQLQMVPLAIAAGVSAGCAGYVIFSVIHAGREEARRFRAMGRPATSPLFKLLRPAARWLGFFAGGVPARIEKGLARPAEKSFLLPARIWAEKKLRSAAYPE